MSEELKPCTFCTPEPEPLHALKNAWATLSYMPCKCGHGFVCGRCNTFNEIDALLKRACGEDWHDREFEAPDHLPDTKKMISPMTSVVTWRRYDGTPETLPTKRDVLLLRPKDPILCKGTFCLAVISDAFNGKSWWQIITDGSVVHYKKIQEGDLWAYLPTPPEASQG